MTNEGIERFRLSYEISPIVFTGGIASNLPGGVLPIISITEAVNFSAGPLSGYAPISPTGVLQNADLDNFFAHFVPAPGSTLLDVQLGRYTFANQSVAANAVIVQPLKISLIMICPVKTDGGYQERNSILTNLQSQINQHAVLGGLYTVLTPSFMYTDTILTRVSDISGGESKQAQDRWQFDFEQPLVTLAGASVAYNNLMGRMAAQVPVSGDPPSYSGTPPTVGNAASGVGPSLVPASTPLQAASAGGVGTNPAAAQ